MNIALTYFCNQRCTYCFGVDAMSMSKDSPEAREITISNLHKVMDFMKKSNILQFNMIGGEPTLHSRFEEIYDTISNNEFSVNIFSNGVIDKHKVNFLSKKDNLKNILLNIREPEEYSKKDWEKISYTLSKLNKKINLSFRIYKLNFDARFLFDLIDKYKLARLINWAIAGPSLIRDNDYINLKDHEKTVERMVYFSVESKKRKIRWYSDAGFIWCAFSDGKDEELIKNVDFSPVTNCCPAIEVAPDLRVFRCFGLAVVSRKDFKITDFNNLKEAENYFFNKSKPFKRTGSMDKCFKCKHIINQKCGGGCMAHIVKRFTDYKNISPIF